MKYDITVKTLDDQPTVTIRRTCKPEEVGRTLEEILPLVHGYLTRLGVDPAGPPFTRYHAFGDAADKKLVDLEAGLPVKTVVMGEGEIQTGELPAGMVARTWHVGSYETLPGAYQALERWIESRGLKPSGPPWEVYWTDPAEEPSPVQWKTEVVWPL